MPAVLVHLDDRTYRTLNRLAPSAKRRLEFISHAIKKAVREAEYDQIRQAYVADPDSDTQADDWSNCEAFG